MFKKRREEEAAALEIEEMKRNQFKAKQYQPDGSDDWESIAEAAEAERTKRLAKRSQEIHESARPPSMLTRKASASGANCKLSLNRPSIVTKEEEKSMKKTLSPEQVRARLEKAQKNWEKRMSTTKEV